MISGDKVEDRKTWTKYKNQTEGAMIYWRSSKNRFPFYMSWCCSLAQSCPTLCNSMDYSTPGFPVLHISQSSLRLTSIESVMPSSHLILCRPLLLLPPIPPSIRVFSNESTLHMWWPKYWSFSFSISPSNEHPGLISFRMDWLDLLQSKRLSRVFSNTTVQKHKFFGAQLSSQSNSHIHTWPLEKPYPGLDRPFLAKWCFCFSICSLSWS